MASKEAFEEATMKAITLRTIAAEHVEHEKHANRLYDAKMQRLEAGDKRNRRKNALGAAFIGAMRQSLSCSRRSTNASGYVGKQPRPRRPPHERNCA